MVSNFQPLGYGIRVLPQGYADMRMTAFIVTFIMFIINAKMYQIASPGPEWQGHFYRSTSGSGAPFLPVKGAEL